MNRSTSEETGVRPGERPAAHARDGLWFGPPDRHDAALVLLFVIEALVFYTQLASRITPFYPPHYDQLVYMVEVYRLIDAFQTGGWAALFAPIIHPASPNGVSFAVQGALLTLIGGPNRTAMLSLNLLYVLALQLVLFKTVRARLQRVEFAWMATALLLSLAAPFYYAGGLYDFRIDFSALCLYGIWVCLILRSDGFSDLRVGLIAAAVGVWLILLRFITVVYLGAVFGGLLVVLLVGIRIATSPEKRADYVRRARNLFICGALTAALAFPVLFAARRHLYDYYGIGHLLSDEKHIRAAELGIGTLFEHLIFYPNNLIHFQLGRPSLWLISALLAAAVAATLLFERATLRQRLARVRRRGFDLIVCALALGVPLAILTLNFAKSPVVAGIAVVPIILLAVTLSASIWPGDMQPGAGLLAPVPLAGLRLAGIGYFVVGFAAFLGNSAVDTNGVPRADRERIVRLNEAIVRYAQERGVTNPKLSVDRVADYINVGTLELYGYESFRRIANFSGHFGHGGYGIFATSREDALRLIGNSDIVVLTDAHLDRAHPYPMNAKIKEYWGELWQWANENLTLVLKEDVLGIPHHVFMRPSMKIGGFSGRWITSAGLRIEVEARDLVRWPFIVLEGAADDHHHNAHLGGRPKPHAAVVEDSGRPGAALPSTFNVVANNFLLVIDAHAAADAAAGRKHVALTFDRFFVPKLIGLGTDIRELVIIGPTSWSLRAQPPN